MEEAIAWFLLIIALLVALRYLLSYILIGGYWFFAALGTAFFGTLDFLFSASLIPGAPWAMWLIWGGVFGAACGFWTIAPIYGLRKQRPWILAAPLGLMLLVALVRLAIKGI